jgi:hypothetical protein
LEVCNIGNSTFDCIFNGSTIINDCLEDFSGCVLNDESSSFFNSGGSTRWLALCEKSSTGALDLALKHSLELSIDLVVRSAVRFALA